MGTRQQRKTNIACTPYLRFMTDQNVIAIIFDCDDTLCEDTTTFLLKKYGIDSNRFWNSVNRMVRQGWDPPLAYMKKIIRMVRGGQLSDLTNGKLRQIGSELEFFPGIPEMFKELPVFINKREEFKEAEVSVEFYVTSCGFEEIIRGSKIAPYMKDIFGCTFDVNSQTGKLRFPKSIVTFTEKTRFVFAINKGISGSELRRSPYEVNNSVDEGKRRIPFSNMIYIGDGPSDIPCLSLIRRFKGIGIGVIGSGSVRKSYELAKGKRVTVGPYDCDYRPGSTLRKMIEQAIEDIGLSIVRQKQAGVVRSPRYS